MASVQSRAACIQQPGQADSISSGHWLDQLVHDPDARDSSLSRASSSMALMQKN